MLYFHQLNSRISPLTFDQKLLFQDMSMLEHLKKLTIFHIILYASIHREEVSNSIFGWIHTFRYNTRPPSVVLACNNWLTLHLKFEPKYKKKFTCLHITHTHISLDFANEKQKRLESFRQPINPTNHKLRITVELNHITGPIRCTTLGVPIQW